jgi:DNA-directed RNA polymerase specialized sigma24 family protein
MSLSVDHTAHPALVGVSTRRDELGPVLSELSAWERKVLSLRYLAGLDDIDVSEALGISVKAVRKYAAQGTAALRSREVIRDAQRPSRLSPL